MDDKTRTAIGRREVLELVGASVVFLPLLANGVRPRRDSATRRLAGASLADWDVAVGDGVYAAPGESPVILDDIRTVHLGDHSELQANVRRREVMAHNITYLQVDDTTALDQAHTATFRFRLPDDPRAQSEERAGQTIEGGLAIWDGGHTRLDYQVLFQWILNPFWPDEYGAIQTAVRDVSGTATWTRVGRLEPDDRWHEAHIVLDARRGTSLIAIDGERFPSVVQGVAKPANWGTETSARLQVEIVSLFPGESGMRPLHRAEVKDWTWSWAGSDCPDPVPPPPEPTLAPVEPISEQELGRWTWLSQGRVNGPPAPAAAGAGELIVFHGDLLETGQYHWYIAGPGQRTCRPKATSVAVLVRGGTYATRRDRAEAIAAAAAASARVSDWRAWETVQWC